MEPPRVTDRQGMDEEVTGGVVSTEGRTSFCPCDTHHVFIWITSFAGRDGRSKWLNKHLCSHSVGEGVAYSATVVFKWLLRLRTPPPPEVAIDL